MGMGKMMLQGQDGKAPFPCEVLGRPAAFKVGMRIAHHQFRFNP